MSADAQSIINKEFGDGYAALVALFGTRLGTPTPRSPKGSGTVEEIENAMTICDHVMVYFYAGRAPVSKLDTKQLRRLQEFKSSLESKGLLGSYRSNPDLRRKLDLHLAQLAYAFRAQINQGPVGEQPLEATAHTIPAVRIEDQAILKILSGENDAGPWIYQVIDDRRAQVKYRIRNIGRAPARDIRAQITIGQNEPVEITGPPVLPSLATTDRVGFVLPLPRPFPGGAGSPVPEDYPPSELIKIRLFYSDFQQDLGEQQTEPFCFRFARTAERARWRSQIEPWERADEAENPPRGTSRPRNLTARDHEVLGTLVRRAAQKPETFQPTILTHGMGDDKQLYASQLHHGAIPDPEDAPNFEHDRDFIPTLVQQGLLIPVRHNEYMMDESLFQSYGHEPLA